MRKKKREMSAEFAFGVFDKAPYATLSMVSPDGNAYGIPVSHGRDGEVFYFHCAHEGMKLDCIASHPEVCLSAVSKCHPVMGPLDGSFTLEFHSAVAFGKASVVTSNEEKVHAMRIICQRYLPAHMDKFDAAIDRSISHTTVVRIDLTQPPTGKRKQFGPDGREMGSDVNK